MRKCTRRSFSVFSKESTWDRWVEVCPQFPETSELWTEPLSDWTFFFFFFRFLFFFLSVFFFSFFLGLVVDK